MNLRQAVVGIFIDKKSRVLIASSPRDGGYKFPQWWIEDWEKEHEAIKREMKEELGVELCDSDIQRVGKVRYLFPEWTRHVYDGQEQVVYKIFYQENMLLQPQDDELDKLYWVSPDDIQKFDTRHRAKAYQEALNICGLFD